MSQVHAFVATTEYNCVVAADAAGRGAFPQVRPVTQPAYGSM